MKKAHWVNVLMFASGLTQGGNLTQIEIAEKMYRRRKFVDSNELNPACVSEADIRNFKANWKREYRKLPRVALP